MDTTYYSFETRKVKVSGGTDLLTIVPTAVPAPASPAGEVLDFERCRRKLETKAAWKGLAQAVAEVKAPAVEDSGEVAYETVAERPAPARRVLKKRRVERAGGWLELLSSVAVILTCVCAGWAFLALV